jgi:hypothetical protein
MDYGVKYLSYDQSGVLGNAQVGTNLFNILNLSTRYKIGKYNAHFKFDTYELKYEASAISCSKKMNSFELVAGYKHFYSGISISDNPIFKNDSGTVLLSKISTLNLVIGYFTSWELPVKKKTDLAWESSFNYSLSASSDNVDIEISNVDSYSIDTSLRLSRELLSKKNYSINLVWPVYGTYTSLKSNLNWGASGGETKSSSWVVGTQLGAEVKF